MEKLNELVKLAGKVLSPENAFDGVDARFEWKSKANPAAILAIAEAYQALEQRVEEAKAEIVPDGWKLVPIEPTRQMMSQGHFALGGTDRGKFRRIYQAMIEAAPEVGK